MSDALLFVVVSFAAYRAWHFVAVDDLPPLVAVRGRFSAVVEERFGRDWEAGVECPWCSGFWVACAVVAVVWALRPLPLPGLWFLAVSAAVGLLGSKLED